MLPTAAGYSVLQQYAASNPRIAAMLAAYGNLRGNPAVPPLSFRWGWTRSTGPGPRLVQWAS